jgi:hypothetical protein
MDYCIATHKTGDIIVLKPYYQDQPSRQENPNIPHPQDLY